MPKLFSPESPIDSAYPLLPEHRGLLGKARVLGRDLYLQRTHPEQSSSAIWFAASSVGKIRKEGDVLFLDVDQILVNEDVKRDHPRVAELIAIEEAVRIHMIGVLWFGEGGYLSNPDLIDVATMPIGDHRIDRVESLDPEQFIEEKFPNGWIDPHFSLPDARMAGLAAGKVCAMRLDDPAILQAYIDNNLRFVRLFGSTEDKDSPFYQIAREQFEIMRSLYTDLFCRE